VTTLDVLIDRRATHGGGAPGEARGPMIFHALQLAQRARHRRDGRLGSLSFFGSRSLLGCGFARRPPAVERVAGPLGGGARDGECFRSARAGAKQDNGRAVAACPEGTTMFKEIDDREDPELEVALAPTEPPPPRKTVPVTGDPRASTGEMECSGAAVLAHGGKS
jgi:hypothetical protein